jgi:hypothetical protein
MIIGKRRRGCIGKFQGGWNSSEKYGLGRVESHHSQTGHLTQIVRQGGVETSGTGRCPGPPDTFLDAQAKYPIEGRPDENIPLRVRMQGRSFIIIHSLAARCPSPPCGPVCSGGCAEFWELALLRQPKILNALPRSQP